MCANLVILLLAVAAFPASAFPDNLSTPSTSTPFNAPLAAPYSLVRASFWRAENKLQTRMENGEARRELFSVLPTDDPLRAEYSRAASAADGYLKLAGENKLPAVPAMLYLGGLAKYSIGDNAGALALLERLRTDYPDYKRDQYLNDRDDLNPQYSVPVSAGVSKLVFYLRLQVALKNTPDAFASLKQITQDALTTLSLQREYSFWLAGQSTKYNVREFDESIFGSEPDQRRAAVLPGTLSLVNEAWDKLIESALQKGGPQGMRDWLRGLSTRHAPLSKLALYRLQSIDALIIKQYFTEAQNQMNSKNFDGARAKYRQLIAEYPGTETAQRATDALPQIVPVAVAYYHEEGEKNFRVSDPDQFMKPQTKSREYFDKMYNEDPDGPQADAALYWGARGLGTEGKTDQSLAQYAKLMQKFPNSPLVPDAMFGIGFIQGANFNRKYDEAIATMMQIVEKYPHSEMAPLGLWYCAFWRAYGQERYADATTYLEMLRKYPDSPYAKQIDDELQKYQVWIKRQKSQ